MLFLTSLALAGELRVTVVDHTPFAMPWPYAHVELTRLPDGAPAAHQADIDGIARISDLRAGTYRVRVHQPSSRDGAVQVRVPPTRPVQVTVPLGGFIGPTREVVETIVLRPFADRVPLAGASGWNPNVGPHRFPEVDGDDWSGTTGTTALQPLVDDLYVR